MTNKLHLVAIGSSAGGLEALIALVSHLPHKANCTYVILQHLSPNATSMLTDILSRNTELPVHTASDQFTPEANTIYVTPPNKDIIVAE